MPRTSCSTTNRPTGCCPNANGWGPCCSRPGVRPNAESVFRKDLERNVANPRSLFGLWKALDAQKKPDAAGARATFEAAWKGADVTLDTSLLGSPR